MDNSGVWYECACVEQPNVMNCVPIRQATGPLHLNLVCSNELSARSCTGECYTFPPRVHHSDGRNVGVASEADQLECRPSSVETGQIDIEGSLPSLSMSIVKHEVFGLDQRRSMGRHRSL